MTDQVLSEIRTFIEANGMATTQTLRRWLAMLETDDDPVLEDARRQARKDAAA